MVERLKISGEIWERSKEGNMRNKKGVSQLRNALLRF